MKTSSSMGNVQAIVMALILVVVIGAIGVFIADKTMTANNMQISNVSASGNLTWSGNSSCGNMINVTNFSGNVAYFYVNITGINCVAVPGGYAAISISSIYNSSVYTATNVTTAMNANVTVSNTMTASNSAASVTKLTYNSAGTGGNSVTLAESAVNASWDGTTLTGGLNMSNVATFQSNILDAGKTGSSFIVILLIALIGGLAIGYLSGMFRGRRS